MFACVAAAQAPHAVEGRPLLALLSFTSVFCSTQLLSLLCYAVCAVLQVLDMCRNPLGGLPPFFSCMQALRKLLLAATHMLLLPAAVSSLIRLDHLNISSNKLQVGPSRLACHTCKGAAAVAVCACAAPALTAKADSSSRHRSSGYVDAAGHDKLSCVCLSAPLRSSSACCRSCRWSCAAARVCRTWTSRRTGCCRCLSSSQTCLALHSCP